MNWGMGEALGRAITNLGEVWGPERLDLRRKLDSDAREEREADRRDKLLGVQTERAQFDLSQDQANAPLERQKIEQAVRAGAISAEQGALALAQLKEQIAAQPADYHQRRVTQGLAQADANLEQTRTSSASNRQSAAASAQSMKNSAAAQARAEDQHKMYMHANRPWAQAEREIEPQVKDLRASVQKIGSAALANYRQDFDPLKGMLKTQANITNDGKPGPLAAMHKQIEQYAELLAQSAVDNYEAIHMSRSGGGPAFARPEDKLGAVQKLKLKYMGALISGDVVQGAPPAAGPSTGGTPMPFGDDYNQFR